jgi:hypothetical protein
MVLPQRKRERRTGNVSFFVRRRRARRWRVEVTSSLAMTVPPVPTTSKRRLPATGAGRAAGHTHIDARAAVTPALGPA